MLALHMALKNDKYAIEDLRVIVKTLATESPRQIANMADTLTINPHGGTNTCMASDKHMENLNAPITKFVRTLVIYKHPTCTCSNSLS